MTLTFATACIDDAEDDPDVGETESELSTWDWSPTSSASNSQYGGQIASLNGTTYMVHTGFDNTNLYWRKRTGWLSWSLPVLIPGQKTSDRVSLAAFDGYLYMVHIGETDTQAVWFSWFDPATETWTTNQKLSMATDLGAPALAGFDGRLWIIGATEWGNAGYYKLWVATKFPGAPVSAATIMNKYTHTPVSLAVFANKLYLAYGTNGNIYTMTHSPGTSPATWSAATPVKGGPQGTTSQGYDPTIAVAGGYLHLIHTRPNSAAIWWTYWNGVSNCGWSAEVPPVTDGGGDAAPSLATGGVGLVLLREKFWTHPNGYSFFQWINEYAAPPPSNGLPQCGGVVGT